MENNSKTNSYRTVKDKTVIILSMVLIILNLLDGGLTLWGLSLKIVYEVNPLMRWLISLSPIGFMTIKFLLPLIFGLIFWQRRHKVRKVLVYCIGFVLILYGFVMIAHAYWIAYLLIFLSG